jgi:hypothetical protein
MQRRWSRLANAHLPGLAFLAAIEREAHGAALLIHGEEDPLKALASQIQQRLRLPSKGPNWAE